MLRIECVYLPSAYLNFAGLIRRLISQNGVGRGDCARRAYVCLGQLMKVVMLRYDETTPPVTSKTDIRSASLNYTETTNVDTLAGPTYQRWWSQYHSVTWPTMSTGRRHHRLKSALCLGHQDVRVIEQPEPW